MNDARIFGLGACHPLWRDRWWWLAVLAAPVFWGAWAYDHPPVPGALAHTSLHFWLSVVLLQPALEEFLFRGMLQGQLLQTEFGQWRMGPASFANILTALIFAGMHMVYHAPLWAALIFIPGLLFGFFRERSGCIYLPFLLHAFYNAGYFLLWPI